jgi:uncharacterized protein
MFSSLMPNRNEFFELLAAHSDRVVAAANAGLRLIQALGTHDADIATLVKEVAHNENSADKIKAELIGLLHKSFTTPINRDQIHTLTIELDLVLNALKEVANSVNMYNITESTAESRELASLGADACLRLHRGVGGLGSKDKERKAETLNVCNEIDVLETKADAIERKAIAKLFDGSQSIWTAIKMREFYTLQENVLNRCEDAAKTIEEILIENS